MMRTARLRRNAGMAGVNGQVSFSSRPQSSCFPASHQARRFVRFRALRLTAYTSLMLCAGAACAMWLGEVDGTVKHHTVSKNPPRSNPCLVRSVGGPECAPSGMLHTLSTQGHDYVYSCCAPCSHDRVCREPECPMLVSPLLRSGEGVHCVRQDVSRCRAEMSGAQPDSGIV